MRHLAHLVRQNAGKRSHAIFLAPWLDPQHNAWASEPHLTRLTAAPTAHVFAHGAENNIHAQEHQGTYALHNLARTPLTVLGARPLCGKTTATLTLSHNWRPMPAPYASSAMPRPFFRPNAHESVAIRRKATATYMECMSCTPYAENNRQVRPWARALGMENNQPRTHPPSYASNARPLRQRPLNA